MNTREWVGGVYFVLESIMDFILKYAMQYVMLENIDFFFVMVSRNFC
jgi:hypothetical protein